MALKIMDYFSKQGEKLVCNACPKYYALTTAKSSHSSLWYHLRTVHSIVRPHTSPTASPQAKRPKTQELLVTYAQKKSQEQIYAELAANDRFSFNQIANSDFIRESMREKMMTAHSAPNTIRSKVHQFFL